MFLRLSALIFAEAISLAFPKICVGDILELKKNHPCGNNKFEVIRVGSEIRIFRGSQSEAYRPIIR